MATDFELILRFENAKERKRAEQLLEACHFEIAKLETELSEYMVLSFVYQLNQSEPNTRLQAPRSVAELWQHSEAVRELSKNAFNPLVKSNGPGSIHFDEETNAMWRSDERVRLSFAAIGKGFAIDRVRDMIRAAGFSHFFLNAGGSSIFCEGFAGEGLPWRFGWSWQKNECGKYLGEAIEHKSGRPLAFGVSGVLEQGSHILDPRSRTIPQNELLSVFVATSSATYADALSTAFFVAGWDGVKDFPQSALASVKKDGELRWNGIFQEEWKPLC